jgi:hypothetical protein
MKWPFLAFGPLAAGLLAHSSVTREPPTGIEFVFPQAQASLAPCDLGAFQIDGLDSLASARATFSSRSRLVHVALPPGLYALRYVPSPQAASLVGRNANTVLVTARSVARVNVQWDSER